MTGIPETKVEDLGNRDNAEHIKRILPSPFVHRTNDGIDSNPVLENGKPVGMGADVDENFGYLITGSGFEFMMLATNSRGEHVVEIMDVRPILEEWLRQVRDGKMAPKLDETVLADWERELLDVDVSKNAKPGDPPLTNMPLISRRIDDVGSCAAFTRNDVGNTVFCTLPHRHNEVNHVADGSKEIVYVWPVTQESGS